MEINMCCAEEKNRNETKKKSTLEKLTIYNVLFE